MSIVKRIAWFAASFFFLILIVLPLLISTLIDYGQLPVSFLKYLGLVETLQTGSMQAFTAAWLFFLGGCFASFINVVAWRVPRGRSIMGSSHCPNCDVRLQFRDNLPVIGWLSLGGKCRNCGISISPRYLITELVLGSVFLFYAAVVLLSGGWNLPLGSVNPNLGFESLLLDPPWDLIQILIYHFVLLTTLFLFALIAAEHFRLTLRVVWFSALMGLLLPWIWPDTLLINWNGQNALNSRTPHEWEKLLTQLIGGGVGWLVGFATLMGNADAKTRLNFSIGLLVLGLFLGWQAAISTVFLSFVIAGIEWCATKKKQIALTPDFLAGNTSIQFWNWNSRLFIATIVHLLIWRWQVGWFLYTVSQF